MNTAPTKSYELVYTLNMESPLGPIVEPYVVEVNDLGHLTLSYQRVYPNTLSNYFETISELDREIVTTASEYSSEKITRKFSKKTQRPYDFFKKEFNEELNKTLIKPFIDKKLNKILKLLVQNNYSKLFLQGVTDNPAGEKVELVIDPLQIEFNFEKTKEGTVYCANIFKSGEILRLVEKDAKIIVNDPCWLLIDDKLYHFADYISSKKISPFLSKSAVQILPKNENAYYKTFVRSMIQNYKVNSKGFIIKSENSIPEPVLLLAEDINSEPAFILKFRYGKKDFHYGNGAKKYVEIAQQDEKYKFNIINRDRDYEEKKKDWLLEMGLENTNVSFFNLDIDLNGNGRKRIIKTYVLLDWLNENKKRLIDAGFSLEQKASDDKKFFIGNPEIEMSIEEQNDWFDVYAVVKFGEHQIPFLKFKHNILNGIKEIELPSGEIAILPEEWFSKFKEVFYYASENEDVLKLRKHHFSIIKNFTGNESLPDKSYVTSLSNLKNRAHIKPVELPETLNARLRSYQKDGYSWLYFLCRNNFGGCLADDMGLGKTVQTLAMLLKFKEEWLKKNEKALITNAGQLDFFSQKKKYTPSDFINLLVMPASLIHNWEEEINKFTPGLKCLNYTGISREELIPQFRSYDIILTTYGTARNDVDLLKDFKFYYLILDESQIIKNPSSKVSKAMRHLEASHRLVLTGTPIENSLTDLWSQMSFLNPGLLGGFKFFKKEYVYPIEKKQDLEKKQRLKSLIRPFILRRTKEEVANDLPSLTETIQYCQMTEEQESAYEKAKSAFRNEIFENIEKFGFNKSQFMILKGLSQLRLLSNHPVLSDETFSGQSGKFEEITRKIMNVANDNHKILIFSQFVRHLKLFRKFLEEHGMSYSYLTGESKNRKAIIDKFRNDEKIKIFLISLKAGGVGLNLVEADYVFIADPWWNPSAEFQAINRAHRIGQKKNVISYKFITQDTIEEKIMKLQKKKAQLASDIVQSNISLNQLITQQDLESLLE